MGVDKNNIRTIIHYDLPQNPSSYIQEVGRSGRDLNPAFAYALIKYKEDSPIKKIFTNKCIREELLKLMGFTLEDACLNCQYCLKTTNTAFGYNEIMKIVKYFPFIASSNNIVFLLIHKFRKYKVKEQDIIYALKYLESEKKIKLFLNHYIKLIDKL